MQNILLFYYYIENIYFKRNLMTKSYSTTEASVSKRNKGVGIFQDNNIYKGFLFAKEDATRGVKGVF